MKKKDKTTTMKKIYSKVEKKYKNHMAVIDVWQEIDSPSSDDETSKKKK